MSGYAYVEKNVNPVELLELHWGFSKSDATALCSTPRGQRFALRKLSPFIWSPGTMPIEQEEEEQSNLADELDRSIFLFKEEAKKPSERAVLPPRDVLINQHREQRARMMAQGPFPIGPEFPKHFSTLSDQLRPSEPALSYNSFGANIKSLHSRNQEYARP